MRVWIMTKRQYMRRDIIDDRYGRFFALASELSALGNEVVVSCLSYRSRKNRPFNWNGSEVREPIWSSWSIGSVHTYLGSGSWRHGVERICNVWRPDAILACADAFQIILASRVARSRGLPLFVDLYDNFESYPATRIPGVRRAFRQAVGNARGVSVISRPLEEYVRSCYAPSGSILVLENAVDKDRFFPQDQRTCRRDLGLPEKGLVIGTAGALDQTRDIDSLYSAFRIFKENHPEATLALAGGMGKHPGPPQFAGLRYFGDLPHDQVARFYGALDLGVICVKADSFGRFCFPQKAVEMAACGIPLVSARVGVLTDLLKDHPECLFEPGNARDLVRSLEYRISQPRVPQLAAASWREQAVRLQSFMHGVLKHSETAENLALNSGP